MNIEIKPRNRAKEFFQRLHSKAEDLLFSVIQILPERFIPAPLMDWTERYINRRITELKHQTVKQAWDKVTLEQVVEDIHARQQDKKEAPSED